MTRDPAKKTDLLRLFPKVIAQPVLVAILLGFLSWSAYSQPCTPDDLLRKTGSWKQLPDFIKPGKNFLPGMQTEIFIRLEKIRQILLKGYTPRGMEVRWERQIYGTPLAGSATVTYSLWGQLLEYACDQVSDKIILQDESTDDFYVLVNHFGLYVYFDTTMRVGRFTVALMANRVGRVQGMDLFQTSWVRNNERFFIVSRAGDLPFIPLTQKQYLLALKEKFQRQEKYFINRDLAVAKDEAARERTRQYWESHIEPKIRVIDEYLAQAQESDLNQTAFVKDMQEFKRFYAEPEGGRMPVIVNASYFNNGPEPYFPQFLTVAWEWNDGEGPPGGILRPKAPDMNICCRVALHFKNSMEDSLDLKALQSLLYK